MAKYLVRGAQFLREGVAGDLGTGHEAIGLGGGWIATHLPHLAALIQELGGPPTPPAGQQNAVETLVVVNGVLTWQVTTQTIPPAILTTSKWRTLVKGLPAAQRTALRNAITAPADDADTDAVYLAKDAARTLLTNGGTKVQSEVIAALNLLLPAPMTQPQIDALTVRWNAVAAL